MMWAFFKEFRDFALRGNMVDMAVGVIIGGAFGKIVASLVNDIVMPPIGMLLTDVNFDDLALPLGQNANSPVIKYGVFITTVLQFVITAFVIFLVIRQMNRVMPRPLPPAMKECPYCLSKIPQAATRCANCTSDLETE